MHRACQMVDQFDDGQKITKDDNLTPSNISKIPEKKTAVALEDRLEEGKAPKITAAGRGKIAEKILQLAFENDIKVREDSDLAEMLTKIEIDSPIPSEAFMAVAEILSYVYRANGKPDPFNIPSEDDKKDEQNQESNE